MPTPPFPDTQSGQTPQSFHTFQWGGVNLESTRSAIDDNEQSWLENYIPIAPGNLRTLYAEGATIYTAPATTTIINAYAFNLGNVNYFIVFLSDGTAVQVNIVGGAQTTVTNNPGDFYIGGYVPAAVQWNAFGIVIVTEASNPNGFFAWDGTTLYRPGSAAPNWLTNQTPTTMPSGIHGNAAEVYQNRLWVSTPNAPATPVANSIPSLISQSASGNGANFSGPSGGGSTPQQDSSLRYTFTALKQTNGFLYAFGDSNVSVISNVQSTGSPLVTTYNNQNVDPQVGGAWPGAVQQFSQSALLFANTQGVFELKGGAVKKISNKLNPLFARADFSLTPTAAVDTIFGIKVYMLLLRSRDQVGNLRNILCMWDGKEWFFGSQIKTLLQVFPQENNAVINAWGTDGLNLFELFQTPSTALTKTIQSKFFTGGDDGWITFKKQYRFYFQSYDYAGSGVVFQGTMDSDFANAALSQSSLTAVNNSQGVLQPQNTFGQNIYAVVFGFIAATTSYFEFTNSSGGIIHFTNSGGGTILWGVASVNVNMTDISNYGRLLGYTLGSTSQDFTLIATMILYSFDATFGG